MKDAISKRGRKLCGYARAVVFKDTNDIIDSNGV